MNRSYNTSIFRVALLAVLLVGLALGGASTFADTAANPAAPAAPGAGVEAPQARGKGVFAIIMENIDGVFITIGVLSIAGVTLIIQGFLQNRRAVLMPDESVRQIRELIGQRKFKELVEFTEEDPSFVSRALNPALKRAPDFAAMKEAMETSVAEQTAEQFRKVEYLNIIGNLGPLLGLLGTVLGMIDAFSTMDAAGGNASPQQLASGISKALAHTFLGLMLAVPCLAAFGILRTMIDRLTVQGALLAEDLLLMIKPADPAAGRGTAPVSGAPRPTGTPQPAIPSPRKPMPAPAPSDL